MWGSWGQKRETVSERGGLLGIDLNAGRARGIALRAGQPPRGVLLDDPHADLPLVVSLERRTPVLGRQAAAVTRKVPHLVAEDFLPALGQPRTWDTGKHRFDAAGLMGLVFDAFRPLCAGRDGLCLTLPAYLTLAQVKTLVQLAEKAKLPVKGSAATVLALAVQQFAADLTEDEATGVIRHPFFAGDAVDLFEADSPPGTSATVVVVDADEYALQAAVIGFDDRTARLLAQATLPRLGVRQWKTRLLDALADRCIRLCRHDPRESAGTEQALYDQLDDALERAHQRHAFDLAVRGSRWYQDLPQQADDFDGYCAGLAKQAATGLKDLLTAPRSAEPPRVAWVTHDAARLPGLVKQLHAHLAERTQVRTLAPDAAAEAAAALGARWQTGELPRAHLDAVIPLPAPRKVASPPPVSVPKVGQRR
jgi:hypothetical protein